jgi:hypothetical protein
LRYWPSNMALPISLLWRAKCNASWAWSPPPCGGGAPTIHRKSVRCLTDQFQPVGT